MHDLSYFLDKNVFDDDGFQNMFVYQPTFNMLDLKTTRKKTKKKTVVILLAGNHNFCLNQTFSIT